MPIFNKKEQHVLIQLESDADWQILYDICESYMTRYDFKLINEYLKNVVKTVVLEKDYVDADYRDTYFNFFSRKFAEYPSKTIRMNFFNTEISPKMLFKLDQYQEEYIGFSVIRPNRVRTIGRTILNPKKLTFITGHICVAEYPVHILGAELKATGFPYISQDTDVTICAHAACWMIFRYFSQRYNRYAEKWPYEVAQLTKDVSTGRLSPSKGLTAYQVTEMFANFGFSPEIYMRGHHSKLFNKLLYMYVESGLPVVAALTGHSHAITIIGHLSDFEESPTTFPSSSDVYLKGLIANDDNVMPYHAIRKHDQASGGYWSKYKIDEIDTFIVPLYEKIHLSAEHVVELSEAILTDDTLGITNRSSFIKYENIITRLFLTSSKSFKKVIRENLLPFGISNVYCEMAMPKFIWICEISTHDLFKKKKIAGEILFDATANFHDIFSFLAIHYPDFLLLNNRDCQTIDPERFIAYDVEAKEMIPYSCYVNNLCEV